MPSNHLILHCPLFLLPSIFPSIRVFSNELTLHIKWSKTIQLQHQSFQWIFRVYFLEDWLVWFLLLQFSSVTQLCPTLSHPMDCSVPGFPVLHHLPEFAQTHVHWVSDAIQASYPLFVIPFSSFLQSFPASGSFLVTQLFASGGQSIGALASASVLPMSIRSWFPLGLICLISLQSRGLSSVFSSTTVQKHQFLALSLLYGPALTSVHDCWKNRSFDYTDLSWQSDVSAF